MNDRLLLLLLLVTTACNSASCDTKDDFNVLLNNCLNQFHSTTQLERYMATLPGSVLKK